MLKINLADYVEMVARDLSDIEEEFDYEFLLLRLVDSAYEYSFFFDYDVNFEEDGYVITLKNGDIPEKSLVRLLSVNTAISILTGLIASLKNKLSETIVSDGFRYDYSQSANLALRSLEELINKRDLLLSELTGKKAPYRAISLGGDTDGCRKEIF